MHANLESWDQAYYLMKFKNKTFEVDERKIEEYFPLEHVKENIMEIQENLFGLKFRQLEDASVWHPDVTCYEVKDTESGKLVGYFYMDIIKRGKLAVHPSAHTIRTRSLIDGEFTPAVGMLMANFEPKDEGKPHTLKHKNVVTFFHEFGHIMHQMCSEANITRFSGTQVERDFVEMPSTMLEHWMKDPATLQKMSKHYLTGEPIPLELINQKLNSIKFENAQTELWTLFLATVDLLMWTAKDKTLLALPSNSTISSLRHKIQFHENGEVDLSHLWAMVGEELREVATQPDTNPVLNVNHIFGAYASKYYSYVLGRV